MMTQVKEDHRVGITPILLRRAAYYLSLGLGEYYPTHPHYDVVRVLLLYPMQPNPINEQEWAIGYRVEFCNSGRVLRWIEFGSTVTGAGGDSILMDAK